MQLPVKTFYTVLEDTASYMGLLLGPAEGFSLRPILFLPYKKVKNGQKSENLEKSQKLLFFFFSFLLKKCYPLSFSILGGRDSTRALQYTPFQNPGGVA